MAGNELKFKFGADVSGFQQGVKVVNTELAKLPKVANSAGFALNNLGRVAQDAPFGFIAIQNNLNPLLESFQRLKAETGSSGATLKALGSSLIGAGGIGFLLSVASSALLLFTNGMGGFGRKTKEATDQAQAFLKTIKDVGSIEREAFGSVQGTASKVQALSAVITDNTKSLELRKRALEELKEVNKAYFGDLTLETAKMGVLTTKVNEYVNALVKEAVVKGFVEEISRISKELADQQDVLDKLRTSMNRAEDAELGFINSIAELRKQGAASTTISDLSIRLINASKTSRVARNEFLQQRDIVETLATAYGVLNGRIQTSVEQSLQFQNTTSGTTKKAKEAVKEIKAIFGSDVTGKSLASLFPVEQVNAFSNATEKLFKGNKMPEWLAAYVAAAKAAQEETDKLTKSAAKLGDFLINTLGNAFTSLFEDILSGSKNAFQSSQAIAGVIKKLIAAAITAAIFAAIISAVLPGAGGFGANFLKLLPKLAGIPQFAEGGIVNKPTFGIFGEAGPEAVIPLSKLSQVLGSIGGPQVVINGRLSIGFDELSLALERNDARRSRLG